MIDYYDVDESIVFDLAYVDLPIHLYKKRVTWIFSALLVLMWLLFSFHFTYINSQQFQFTWTLVCAILTFSSWITLLHIKNQLLNPIYLSIYPEHIQVQYDDIYSESTTIPFKYMYRSYFELRTYVDEYGSKHEQYFLHIHYTRFDYEHSDYQKYHHTTIELINMSERDARYYAKVVYLLMRNYHQRHDLTYIMENAVYQPNSIPR